MFIVLFFVLFFGLDNFSDKKEKQNINYSWATQLHKSFGHDLGKILMEKGL